MQFSVILWLTKKTKVKVQQDELIQTGFFHIAETAHRVKQKQPPDPVDTGRKLDVYKTFRKRPGRLLNVLCMFNLHYLQAQLSRGALLNRKFYLNMYGNFSELIRY